MLIARAEMLIIGGPVFPLRYALNSNTLFNPAPFSALIYFDYKIVILSADIMKKL